MSTREVVIVDGARTAIGTLGRTLRNFTMEELGALALKGLLEKTGITEKAHVDTVFAGSALHASSALNPARWMCLAAGMPITTAASYIEMQCGSAIDSINHAAWRIIANQADVVIAGGIGILQPGNRQILNGNRAVQADPSHADQRSLSPTKDPATAEHGTYG